MNDDSSLPVAEPENLPRLLIVDDEPSVRELLQRYFTHRGFSVMTAENGTQALEMAKQHMVHLILVDFLLPDLDGVELVARLKKIKSRRPVILMTGYGADDELARKATDAGAAECVSKTSPLEDLLRKITALLGMDLPPSLAAKRSVSEKTREAAPQSFGASSKSARSNFESESFSIEIACSMLSACHPNLGSTATRASALARTAGRVLSLTSGERLTLERAAAWHDIALLSWERSSIQRWFQAPSQCASDEMALITKHPIQSAEMLEFSDELSETRKVIRSHHECWNGEGFPDRLEGEAIPWFSRLLSVIIAYCNQTFPTPQSYALVRRGAGSVFDPAAIDAVFRAVSIVELPSTIRLADAGQITAGVKLAQDVVDRSGTLLVAKGAELTSAWISRIANAQNPRAGGILIYC